MKHVYIIIIFIYLFIYFLCITMQHMSKNLFFINIVDRPTMNNNIFLMIYHIHLYIYQIQNAVYAN